MSNYLAIAGVTEVLRYMIQSAVEGVSPGVKFYLDRPDVTSKKTGTWVNIYLFQVTHNSSLRNMDLPGRRADGSVVQTPVAALDLHYLISFSGGDSVEDMEREIEAQKLYGATVALLNGQPIMGSDLFESLVDGEDEAIASLIAGSGLARQIESVRITPTHLNLEELSKLWSVFFQTPYTLSTAYQCSVVLVESEIVPQPSLPVRTHAVRGVPFAQPEITVVRDEDGGQITPESTLLIEGSGLRGENVTLLLGNLEIPLPTEDVGSRTIRVDLSDGALVNADDLRAGPVAVRLLYRVEMEPGEAESARYAWASNSMLVSVHPVVDSSSFEDDPEDGPVVSVDISPPVANGQRVSLLLNEFEASGPVPPRAYMMPASSLSDADDPVATLVFPVGGVVDGTYLLRVQIDGVDSLLETGGDEKYNNPRITIG